MYGVFVALFGEKSVDENYHANLDFLKKIQCTRPNRATVTLRIGGNSCETVQICMIFNGINITFRRQPRYIRVQRFFAAYCRPTQRELHR